MKTKTDPAITGKRTEYQPKTGQACGCKRGIERDNCANCEGTGMAIDFRAIRARKQAAPLPIVPGYTSESAQLLQRVLADAGARGCAQIWPVELIATNSPLYLRRMVRALNAEAMTGNGFYYWPTDRAGMRCNRARLVAGVVQVRSLDAGWLGVAPGNRFETCNGVEIVASRKP